MDSQLNRGDIILLIRQIMNANGSEGEIADAIDKLEAATSYNGISDLIFYPKEVVSAEQIADFLITQHPPRLPHVRDDG